MAPRLIVGQIVGIYGVRGWVRVRSETDPRENILRYTPWFLGDAHRPHRVREGRLQGRGLVARLAGIRDRDQAAALVGASIAIERSQLPPPAEDEFYWADLEGLRVLNREGEELGRVARLFATPGNDVLVVQGERERLIPFLWESVIQDVDLERGWIRVDWDPEF